MQKLELLEQKIKEQDLELKQLKEKIALQDISLNAALNSTVITDISGNIIWVNEAFTKLTGYDYNECIGQNPRVLKSGKHSDSFYKNMWSTITAGEVWEGEITNKKKNGDIYHEEIVITPVIDSTNIITHFVATKQDITNHKQIDDALNESYIKYEELAYIFNQSPAVGFLWTEGKKRTVEFVTDNIKLTFFLSVTKSNHPVVIGELPDLFNDIRKQWIYSLPQINNPSLCIPVFDVAESCKRKNSYLIYPPKKRV